MGLSGIPAGAMSPMGRTNASATSRSPLLKSPAMQAVLLGLNITSTQLIAQKLPGVQLPRPLAETLDSLRLIQPNATQLEALKHLGLEQVAMTLVVSDESQIKKIKKQLQEVSRSVVNKEVLYQLGIIFETDVDDAMIDDNGSMILLNGMTEIKQSIEEE